MLEEKVRKGKGIGQLGASWMTAAPVLTLRPVATRDFGVTATLTLDSVWLTWGEGCEQVRGEQRLGTRLCPLQSHKNGPG